MIIALEGGICSGKTTLAKQLEKRGFFNVPEYMDIITPQEQQELDTLISQDKSALPFFLKMEKRRKELYGSQSLQRDSVLDRSYLTLFAYEFAKNNTYPALDLASKENVIIPDLIIFLDVNDQLRKQRSQERKDVDMPEIFLNSEFNQRLKTFFLEKSSEKCIFINSEKLEPEQMANILKNINIKQRKQMCNLFQNMFQLGR